MSKTISKNKFWLVVIVSCLAFSLSSSNAFAWGGHGDGHWGGHGGGRYYWHGGRWYGPGWFGFDVAVSALAIGAVVEGLPYGYTTVVVGGVPYYCYGGYYYRQYPYGYAVVPAPVVSPNVVYAPASTVVATPATVAVSPAVAQPQASTDQIVTINIPNANGSYVPVTMVKHGNGYIGPQGEYYEGHPTVKQLKVLYGN